MQFNLASLKAVLMNLSYADMRAFARGVSGEEPGSPKQTKLMDAITDWAEKYEPPVEQSAPPPVPVSVGADSPLPEDAPPPREVEHLVVPKDCDYMLILALVPAENAERFQRGLPDIAGVHFACDWIQVRELNTLAFLNKVVDPMIKNMAEHVL